LGRRLYLQSPTMRRGFSTSYFHTKRSQGRTKNDVLFWHSSSRLGHRHRRVRLFPHLMRQRVYGVAEGRIRIEDREKIDIDFDNNAVIAPFAQREMVDAFIEGLEPGYGRRADMATFRLAGDLIEAALEQAGLDDAARDSVRQAMGSDIRDRFGELARELADVRIEYNVQPIIEVVAALPKDELAAMAESLVNLTSFKRRVSKSAETVGGPIDVAVISRGDGFVWIRRKHYFPPELNPRYMVNLTGRNNG
jgi:hypothetical protein